MASASDDRTVRVWGLEGSISISGGGARASESEGKGQGEGNDGSPGDGRLLWTGWGHASRVWDVGFTKIGVVSCGEVRQPAEAFRGKPVDLIVRSPCGERYEEKYHPLLRPLLTTRLPHLTRAEHELVAWFRALFLTGMGSCAPGGVGLSSL